MNTPITAVAAVTTHRIAPGASVTIAGWVRTLRTSKGGFSFIAVHDGSCFDALQVVAAESLPNYTQQIIKLTTGCAVTDRKSVV